MADIEKPKAEDTELRARVRREVQTRGVRATARALGLSRDATLGLAADAPVHAGTLAQARERLSLI